MPEHWIIPCNIKHFDVRKHFLTTDTVVWRNSFSIREGDTVYIYIGAPVSELLFQCKAVSTCVPSDVLEANAYAVTGKKSNNYYSKKEKYIILQKEVQFPDGYFPLAEMRENGLGQVQIQARTDRRLQRYIDLKISEMDLNRRAE